MMETEQQMEFLSEVFEAELAQGDLDKEVVAVLEWDSFHIMDFLVRSEECFGRRISIEEISEVRYVGDLLQLLEEK